MKPTYKVHHIDSDGKKIFEQEYEQYLKKLTDAETQKNRAKWLLRFSNDNILTFPSRQTAMDFLNDMAQKKMRFDCFLLNKDGTHSGEYFVSLGDGQLRKGNISSDLATQIMNNRANLDWEKLSVALASNDSEEIENVLNSANSLSKRM